MASVKAKTGFHITGTDHKSANKNILKMELAFKINDAISSRFSNQKQAAQFLSISQSRVSEIANNKIQLFTIDKLIDIMQTLDYQLDVDYPDGGNLIITLQPLSICR